MLKEGTSLFLMQSQEGPDFSRFYCEFPARIRIGHWGRILTRPAIAKGCINDAELWCYGGRGHAEA
jgi:hypothetical protein